MIVIAGTSTGGIIALGLAARLTVTELRDLYIERGCEIFPPARNNPIGWVKSAWRSSSRFVNGFATTVRRLCAF